ncbi:anti-sigma factor, partial [Rhodospirillum rubrum]|uniref:cupin domain-containing protein n=2 Tax=Rhodospirillum rubrum TaxID=1085 RepID=UPI00190494C6
SPTRATASRLPPPMGEAALLPAPLRRCLADPSAAALPWRAIAPGIRQIPLLPRTDDGGNAHLLKIAAKTALPHHGHHGREYTLVLSGAFQDCSERFARGDVAEVEADRVHRPITDSQDCLCLVVTEGPLRYMGIIPRLMQPFTGF